MKLTKEFMKQYTPDKVEQLCEEQRWSESGVEAVSMSSFGNVPEYFEEIAQTFPEGSDSRERYMDAAKEAKEIYRQQILSDIRRFSSGKGRAEHENAAVRMRTISEQYKNINKAVSARAIWSSYMIGDWYMKKNPSRANGNLVSGRTENGIGYRQFRMK